MQVGILIIWCYVNYCRRLEGKPEIDFEEIAVYYDQAKAGFIERYGDPDGMFADDPTLRNRDNIREYITLPLDYGISDR